MAQIGRVFSCFNRPNQYFQLIITSYYLGIGGSKEAAAILMYFENRTNKAWQNACDKSNNINYQPTANDLEIRVAVEYLRQTFMLEFSRNKIILALDVLEQKGFIKKIPHLTAQNRKDTNGYLFNYKTVQIASDEWERIDVLNRTTKLNPLSQIGQPVIPNRTTVGYPKQDISIISNKISSKIINIERKKENFSNFSEIENQKTDDEKLNLELEKTIREAEIRTGFFIGEKKKEEKSCAKKEERKPLAVMGDFDAPPIIFDNDEHKYASSVYNHAKKFSLNERTEEETNNAITVLNYLNEKSNPVMPYPPDNPNLGYIVDLVRQKKISVNQLKQLIDTVIAYNALGKEQYQLAPQHIFDKNKIEQKFNLNINPISSSNYSKNGSNKNTGQNSGNNTAQSAKPNINAFGKEFSASESETLRKIAEYDRNQRREKAQRLAGL